MSRDELLLPYALKDGRLVTVEQALRGLACGCICPACKESVIAKKGGEIDVSGRRKREHFAHVNGAGNCVQPMVRYQYSLAEEVLKERLEIRLPPVWIGAKYYPPKMYPISSVSLTQPDHQIQRRLLVEILGQYLRLEIRLGGQLSRARIRQLRTEGTSTIDLNLSESSHELDRKQFERIIVDEDAKKKWIYNAKAKQQFAGADAA